ncbi:hypothetical protein [Vibrio tarriae]|uniref:hypothetical protein n=1 Tax=Vibrio tarriae TaxID=2014742 RepID=UPI000DE1B2ED|nr:MULTISPECIES: hypothetical protein [Vibrio]EGR0627779.1 hypothetical protein [Vibrio cholerae]EIA4707332.1 hypothetical protein [Vibrio cholerae]EJL6883505.1 hypothetical protein [Vibrio cholerae]EKF9598598.1 hypothetical protein [Vibrio cholerae]MBD1196769.1 hypothetical protein [Vibrio cholerae]
MNNESERNVNPIIDFVQNLNRDKFIMLHNAMQNMPESVWENLTVNNLPQSAVSELSSFYPNITSEEILERIKLISRVAKSTSDEQFADILNGDMKSVPNLGLSSKDASILINEPRIIPIVVVGITVTVHTVAINECYDPKASDFNDIPLDLGDD